jgi:hypothetical protein
MAIGFTAELSHYTSAVTYATRANIPATAAHTSPLAMAPVAAPTEHSFITPRWRCHTLEPSGTVCCVSLEDPELVVCEPSPYRCPSGQTVCLTPGDPIGYGCFDLQNNNGHCGTCQIKCSPGQGCFGGTCLTILSNGCPAQWTPCADSCCAPGATCSNGKCQCPGFPLIELCGMCGLMVAECSSYGDWRFTGECTNQGVCFPGSTATCGLGTATCGSDCQWEWPCNCGNPSGSLSSNSNYLFVTHPGSDGVCAGNIRDLNVSLTAVKNMTATVTTNPPPPGKPVVINNGGFDFQLNAYNPAGPGPTTTWMQYVFWITGNAINYQVQYWDLATACGCCKPTPTNPNPCPVGCTCPGGQTVNLGDTVVSGLPSNTIPAGYVLDIDLETDVSDNVTAAVFTVTDNTGKIIGSKTATLDPSHQFPIAAFEANVVGPDNSSNSQFPSGAGTIATITYRQLPGPDLCVEGVRPDKLCNTPGSKIAGTAETSNVSYSTFGWDCCATWLIQSVST